MALTSTISNTLTDPHGGVVANVPVTVTLQPTAGFRVDDATEVARVVSTTTNGSGVWSLTLERNSNITPSSSYYQVDEAIPLANGGARTWNIQVGASDQTVSAALVTPLPAAQASGFLTQASADARYQALGSLSAVTPVKDSQTAGVAGVSTSASRGDHQHQQADSTPRGTVGTPGKATANQGTFTAVTDLTGLASTFTAVSGRRYKVSSRLLIGSSVAADVASVNLQEGSTVLQIVNVACAAANAGFSSPLEIELACPGDITAAAHTYKLTANRATGTGNITMFAGATSPAFILVEDIGV